MCDEQFTVHAIGRLAVDAEGFRLVIDERYPPALRELDGSRRNFAAGETPSPAAPSR